MRPDIRVNHYQSFISSQHTRSLHSTPERPRYDVPNEDEKEEVLSKNIGNSNSSHSKRQNSFKSGTQGTGSNSNLSDKSRISSVVYPSKTKKNPNNSKTDQSKA